MSLLASLIALLPYFRSLSARNFCIGLWRRTIWLVFANKSRHVLLCGSKRIIVFNQYTNIQSIFICRWLRTWGKSRFRNQVLMTELFFWTIFLLFTPAVHVVKCLTVSVLLRICFCLEVLNYSSFFSKWRRSFCFLHTINRIMEMTRGTWVLAAESILSHKYNVNLESSSY